MPNRRKNINSVVGNKIRELRNSRKMTQKELAELLYKSESTVRMWELGKSEPDLEMIKRIAEFFDVSSDYILGQTEKPAESGEPSENVIIYHRDGKNVKREFTKEQMDMLVSMIEAIPEKPKDI